MPKPNRRYPPMLAVAILATLTTACASSGLREHDMEVPPATVIATGDGGSLVVGTQTQRTGRVEQLNLEPAAAYAALARAYDLVGIEPRTQSASEQMLGNAAVVARRLLNGERLSLYVDCGADATLARLADTYDVRMSVMSQVRSAEGGGSTILTRVDATARPVQRSGSPVNCTSTGELERRIANHVRHEASR